MQTQEYIGRRFDTLQATKVAVADGKIVGVDAISDDVAAKNDELPILGPGFFDVQINGAVGVEFSSSKLTENGVVAILEKMRSDGVFRCCPTLTTNAPETMIEAARTIAATLEKRPDLSPLVWGIHLEGPFISTADGAIGAHPKRFCVEYSRELFRAIQDACGGLVKLLTLTPEYPNAADFIRFLRAENVCVAIGHTNADGAQLDDAVRAGATLSTHLSNATRHLLPKWENYLFGQLADDRLTASLIVDGFHISPQLVRALVRTKGLDRLILVSDQSPLAGFPPGKYTTELCDCEIQPNGKVTLAGDPNKLASAASPISCGLVNVATIEDLPLSKVYPLCSTNPARLLGAPRFSSGDGDFLEVGSDADFLLFRVEKATFGERGLYDGAAFQTGRLRFEKIVWRGREVDFSQF